ARLKGRGTRRGDQARLGLVPPRFSPAILVGAERRLVERDDDAARRAELVNGCQVFGGDRAVERPQVVFELRERTRPDDRARDPGLADRQRERELAHGNALLFGDLLEGVDGFERPGATEESRGPLVRAVREAALGLIAL